MIILILVILAWAILNVVFDSKDCYKFLGLLLIYQIEYGSSEILYEIYLLQRLSVYTMDTHTLKNVYLYAIHPFIRDGLCLCWRPDDFSCLINKMFILQKKIVNFNQSGF